MNILNLDFEKHLSSIIDVLVEVYGEENRSIIEKKAKQIIYIPYAKLEGVRNYYNSLLSAKSKELTLKFLQTIGLDIGDVNKINLLSFYEDDLYNLKKKYLGYSEFLVNECSDNIGIKSFLEDLELNKNTLRKQIEFINNLRDNQEPLITLDSYEQYKTTNEYFELNIKIQEYLNIFKKLQQEMNEFSNSIIEYKEFIDVEEAKQKEVYDAKKINLYCEICKLLPEKVIEFIDSKQLTVLEEANMILAGKINCEFHIEYFSNKYEEKLNDPKVEKYEKEFIRSNRIIYLSKFIKGISPYCSEDEYNKILECEEAQVLIPKREVADKIAERRKILYEEAETELIHSNKFFIQNKYKFNINSWDVLCEYMKRETTCVAAGNNDKTNEKYMLLYFCIGKLVIGTLDYAYIHEFVHSVETEYIDFIRMCGYEKMEELSEKNPYNPQKRKYEIMNETFTDIIALEIQKKLHDKDIYMFEPKHLIHPNIDDINTSRLLKNILYPLYQKYKSLILKTRLMGDIKGFCNVIGNDNYENLNDVINNVYYLIDQGLCTKLYNNITDDPLVIEYNKQLERASEIYKNIEELNFVDEEETYNKYYY